ncbi:MAG TPA: hypothetical protein VM688_10015 [Nocardioidaceae bacterium]|nr:hypothetical protein [Nocardioidaceae bacterium]
MTCLQARATTRVAQGVAWVVALLLCVTGCTLDSAPHRSASNAPVQSAPEQPSAPFRVAVTRVSGKLTEQQRTGLAADVRRVLAAYLDAAFLGGTYPRSDFTDSFGTFTTGAARTARRDRDLLTNERLGPHTESVRAVRRTAFLSVLAPSEVAAGVTANVNLDLMVRTLSGPSERVRLKGRLLLTRNPGNGWSIFGYDVSRSDTPVRSAS